jgi:hypothetical protein
MTNQTAQPTAQPRNLWCSTAAILLGFIGVGLGLVGAIATIPMHLGPAWYPISIVVTALPFTWLGGMLHRVTACR